MSPLRAFGGGVASVISGAVNFAARVTAGRSVGTRLEAILSRPVVGRAVSLAPITLTTPQTAGRAVEARASGTVTPAQTAGRVVEGRNTGTAKPPVTVGRTLDRMTFDLDHLSGPSLTGQELLLKDAILTTPNLRSYWSMGDAPPANQNDQGPLDNDLVVSGSPTEHAGLVGAAAGNDGAVTFPASTYYTAGADSPDYALSSAYTMMALVNPNGAPAADGNYDILSKKASAAGAGWQFRWARLLGVNNFEFRFNADGITLGSATAATHHLAVTGDGTTTRGYLNGTAGVPGGGTFPSANSEEMRVRRPNLVSAHGFTVDEVAYFNRACSAEEVGFINTVRSGASSGDWTNLANAQGAHNGTLASIPGNLLNPRAGTLICDFANFPNKSSMTITKVELHFYTRRNNVASLGTYMIHRYRFGASASWIDLDLYSGLLSETNFLTTPRIYDLTSAVGGDWTKLDSLQAGVFGAVGILAILGDTVECDSVELVVEATETLNL